MKYKPTIGLEVHAELKTESKMFCGCKNEPHGSEPNTYICPVCTAQPGSLPVPNKEAIKKVLMFGEAVGATVATYSEFDRKNYFYPDIPKAYQISQYAYPFLKGGEVNGVTLTRVHLEEDTARSSHLHAYGSQVDFNRAGVPLMELVTEPVIHDAVTAGNFGRELQLLLRTLGISEANMERGEMRVEANISISCNDDLGVKVEVKNLNSFKSVEQAIAYEISRQAEILDNNGSVKQETRGWDENRSKTFSQRAKETSEEYRYFPDPDLPKMQLQTAFDHNEVADLLPTLPSEKRANMTKLGVASDQIEVIISDSDLDKFWTAISPALQNNSKLARLSANYLTSDLSALKVNAGYDLSLIKPEYYLELMEMLEKSEINSRIAKDMLEKLPGMDTTPRQYAEAHNLLQISDESMLIEVVEKVIAEHKEVAEEYKAGKETSLNFLLGQVMKATQGSANPALVSDLLKKKLIS